MLLNPIKEIESKFIDADKIVVEKVENPIKEIER